MHDSIYPKKSADRAQHYGIVHDNLLASIGDLFGDAITPEVGAGWSQAVKYLAMILMNREEELYAEAEQRAGGWRGWKEFVVSERLSRTKDVVSWSFKRTDGYSGKFDFTTGQFLSIKVDAEKLKSETPIAPRHYTITSKPGEDNLQCTVKRIEGGVVSNWMHDNLMEGDAVMLAPPFGMFTPKPGKKVVLISAGIGITPMIAMIKHFSKEEIAKIVHVDRSADYPFKSFLEDCCKDKVSSFVRNGNSVVIDDVVAAAVENGTEHTFYLCGPPGFMAEMLPALKQKGCKHVEHEVFGPQLAGLRCPMRS
jgi:nitric oxide dioxygenase